MPVHVNKAGGHNASCGVDFLFMFSRCNLSDVGYFAVPYADVRSVPRVTAAVDDAAVAYYKIESRHLHSLIIQRLSEKADKPNLGIYLTTVDQTLWGYGPTFGGNSGTFQANLHHEDINLATKGNLCPTTRVK
ncbi:MAG: hypothetical protein DDT34_02452 [Firmicutes bacterium]|nr:hypothetical protein [Bacillota bacterium]